AAMDAALRAFGHIDPGTLRAYADTPSIYGAREIVEAILYASARADRGNPLADLRDRLVRDQAILMDRKVAAYNAHDTTSETHLDGQIAGLALALRYIAEEARR